MRESAARSLIAARLQELGHTRDYLSPAAEHALIGQAGGSRNTLQAMLSATLFIASTEDAVRIEPAHVGQATLADAPATRPTSRHPLRAACIAACVAALAMLAPSQIRMPQPTPVPAVQTQATAPNLQTPPEPAVSAPPKPPPAAPRAPLPSHLDRLVAMLPAGPPPSVRLLVVRPGAPEAARVEKLLSAANLPPTVLTSRAVPTGSDIRVLYYFIEDQSLAERAAAAVLAPPPTLATRAAPDFTAPGTIEIILPAAVPEPRKPKPAMSRPPIRRHVYPAHTVQPHGFLDSVGQFFGSIFHPRKASR